MNREAAGPFPFETQTLNTGLAFGVSTVRTFEGSSIHQRTNLEWTLGVSGLPDALNNRKAVSWDTQVICLQYFSGTAKMDFCLVPGSPYMTATFTNAAVNLTSMKGIITDIEWVTPGQ
jgi:endo-1,3(4)-beta-glucanase